MFTSLVSSSLKLLRGAENSVSVPGVGSARPPWRGAGIMLGLGQRLGLFIVAGLAMTGISRQASAGTVMTPFGVADDSCVHETPMGAGIDAQSGDVAVNGKVVDHYGPCAVPWKLKMPKKTSDNEGPPIPATGWYSWSDAQAASISGTVYPYDELYVDWTVPTNPSNVSGDYPIEYMFSGLQNNQSLSSNGTGCGSTMILIQPVLEWGDNTCGGTTPSWQMASWEVWGCTASGSSCTSCNTAHSPWTSVSASDSISGEMWQYANNLDAWEIYMYDNTSSAWTYNTLYNISSSSPKFESAQMGVFEAYNLPPSGNPKTCTTIASLAHCSDLSHADSLTFDLVGAYQADPSWNSFYETDAYGSNQLSWGGWVATSPSPSCSWWNSVTSTTTDITWVY